MTTLMRGAQQLLITVLPVLLGACGFHLRSYELDSSVASVHVATTGNNVATEPLTRALRQAGVTLSPVADEAEVVVELLDDRQDRRSVSVTETSRAAEYETTIGIRYSVVKPDKVVLIPPSWVQTTRIYRVDRVNIVGSSEEQALLEREMVNDLVQQILRALDAATRESAGAA